MIFLDYIYNKVYAPVEDDFGFDDAGDMNELDDELQMEEETAASGEGGDELYEHWKVQVDANQDPVRIDKYLADKMAYQSRNRIQQAADAGFIHVNGKPVKSNYKVRPNDLVTLMLDRPRHETSIKPEEIAINVVYEDDQLMVVNKEAGMVVHPGAGNFHGTLIQAVAWHLRDMPEFDANDPEVGLVHRIDKDTSGLLVVAKTPTAKTALGKQFFNKTTHRSYNALVWSSCESSRMILTILSFSSGGSSFRIFRERLVSAIPSASATCQSFTPFPAANRRSASLLIYFTPIL